MLRTYPGRTVLGLALIVSQAFLYNGVFFTFPLVLRNYYGVPPIARASTCCRSRSATSWGRCSWGGLRHDRPQADDRRDLTASALLLALTGYLFWRRALTAATQTILWALIFFFASSAASSAYLTVSEIFPVELRACHRPVLRGRHHAGRDPGPVAVRSPDRHRLAGLPLLWESVRGGTADADRGGRALFGVKAERTSLEEIAEPLSAVGKTEAQARLPDR